MTPYFRPSWRITWPDGTSRWIKIIEPYYAHLLWTWCSVPSVATDKRLLESAKILPPSDTKWMKKHYTLSNIITVVGRFHHLSVSRWTRPTDSPVELIGCQVYMRDWYHPFRIQWIGNKIDPGNTLAKDQGNSVRLLLVVCFLFPRGFSDSIFQIRRGLPL